MPILYFLCEENFVKRFLPSVERNILHLICSLIMLSCSVSAIFISAMQLLPAGGLKISNTHCKREISIKVFLTNMHSRNDYVPQSIAYSDACPDKVFVLSWLRTNSVGKCKLRRLCNKIDIYTSFHQEDLAIPLYFILESCNWWSYVSQLTLFLCMESNVFISYFDYIPIFKKYYKNVEKCFTEMHT